jgi:dTDP-glucose pyrophosphorylase
MHNSNKSWLDAVLPLSATVNEAIKNLDFSAVKIILIIDEAGCLKGTLSDGDIRRGLLKGLNLDSSIISMINSHPLVVPPVVSRDLVVQLMTANKIQQIPVVDEDGRVIGLHLWDEISAPRARENLMVIMAGGMGTRLRPHTDNCPKPLLSIAGKPMLEHIIERAKLDGFSNFLLATHYLGHMIEEYFGDGSRLSVSIRYLRERAPLGTAGALSLIAPYPEMPFIVTNGDVITDIRYGELLDFHERHSAFGTMAVRIHEWQHPFGVVQMEGVEIIGFEEKPIALSHINAGVYALDPLALNFLEAGVRCDMPTLFERLQSDSKRTVAYPMHEPWLDVGRPADLHAANIESSNKLGQS